MVRKISLAALGMVVMSGSAMAALDHRPSASASVTQQRPAAQQQPASKGEQLAFKCGIYRCEYAR